MSALVMAIPHYPDTPTGRYLILSERLGAMRGELSSTRRWLPPQVYPLAAATVRAVLGLIWLVWRLLRRQV